jgi:3-hydroxyacyl-[acyl-carrier-protein] dehydratase
MWIDRITALEPGKRLVAVKCVSLAEEHLHDHFAAGMDAAGRAVDALPVMPASLILEGVAQTGGILVGHAEGFREKVILAKVNRAELVREATPGCVLRYTATLERMDAAGAAVKAEVALREPGGAGALGAEGAGDDGFAVIGSVEMMFSHLDQNMGGAGAAGADFPAHNFVFGEQFRTLLRCSGFGG